MSFFKPPKVRRRRKGQQLQEELNGVPSGEPSVATSEPTKKPNPNKLREFHQLMFRGSASALCACGKAYFGNGSRREFEARHEMHLKEIERYHEEQALTGFGGSEF